MASVPIALAAVAFNLICSGESYISHEFGPKENITATTTTYRIDLERQRWCADACVETKPIYQAGEGAIVLSASETSPGFDEITTINRESGDWLSRSRALPLVFMTTGKCERAEFTGFPTRKF